MEHEELAHKYGFSNYEEMLENSTTVIFDYGVSWMATCALAGWLTWVDKCPDLLLETFPTYDEASRYIHAVFEDTEASLKVLIESAIVKDEDFPTLLN